MDRGAREAELHSAAAIRQCWPSGGTRSARGSQGTAPTNTHKHMSLARDARIVAIFAACVHQVDEAVEADVGRMSCVTCERQPRDGHCTCRANKFPNASRLSACIHTALVSVHYFSAHCSMLCSLACGRYVDILDQPFLCVCLCAYGRQGVCCS